MNLLDNHVHTTFSRDGKDSMETVIKKAIDIGTRHLTFTDHMEYNTDKFSIDLKNTVKLLKSFSGSIKTILIFIQG